MLFKSGIKDTKPKFELSRTKAVDFYDFVRTNVPNSQTVVLLGKLHVPISVNNDVKNVTCKTIRMHKKNSQKGLGEAPDLRHLKRRINQQATRIHSSRTRLARRQVYNNLRA